MPCCWSPDRRDWAALLVAAGVGGLAANLTEGTGAAVSLGFAVANCGESLIAAWLLERTVHRPFSLASPRATVAFVAIGGVAAPMVGGLAAAGVAAAAFDAPYGMTWLVWWTSAGLGILALTPPVLALQGRGLKGLTPRALAESLVTYVLLVGATALVFSADPTAPPTVLDRPIVILPILLVAAVRFDNRVVALMLATLDRNGRARTPCTTRGPSPIRPPRRPRASSSSRTSFSSPSGPRS